MLLDFRKVDQINITRNYIFSRITQEELWQYYVPNFTMSNKIKSPLRDNDNPSFSFTRKGGVILFRDWGTDEKGDIVIYICKKFNCSYSEALNIINNDLIKNNPLPKKIIKEPENEITKEKHKKIIPRFQPFKPYDIVFWAKYGINMETLVKYDVSSCKIINLWSNSKQKYVQFFSKPNEPMFSYKFSYEGFNYYKVYRPYSEIKWLFNGFSECIEGYDQLPFHGEHLIITKSLKDVMVLDSFGYNSISLQGEANPLTASLYLKLKKRFNKITLLYDNDKAGIRGASSIAKQFEMEMYFLKDEKDISDYIKKNGRNKTKIMLKELYE